MLEVMSLQDILEINDLSEADVLLFLVEEEFLELPDVKPL